MGIEGTGKDEGKMRTAILTAILSICFGTVPVSGQDLLTRTTIAGCGAGYVDGVGSNVVTWFPNVNIWKESSGLPIHLPWLRLVNPTPVEQMVTIYALEYPVPPARTGYGFRVPGYGSFPVNLEEWFFPWRPRVDMGLEIQWQTVGVARLITYDENWKETSGTEGVSGCREVWPRSPYGR